METPFASFLVARSNCGRGYCATTRAADRGEAGQIGLPGGKVDAGETGADAALREAGEEGWQCPAPASELVLVHSALVEDRLVHWYSASTGCAKRVDYKERGRIKPIVCSLEALAESGYGNNFLAGDIFASDSQQDGHARLAQFLMRGVNNGV